MSSRSLNALLMVVPLSCMAVACVEDGKPGDPGAAGERGPQGETGRPGEQGPQGAPAAATLSWIQPSSVFPDRAATVQIAGAGTHFGPMTTIDFGDPEISVSEIAVASIGLIQATVRTSADARLGAHDVVVATPTVGDGGVEERADLKGAFVVAAALTADPEDNSLMAPQGGVVEYSARNGDRDNPLSGNARLLGGARALHISIFANHLAGTGIVDALHPPGVLPLAVTAGIVGPGLRYSLDPADANNPQVVARAPTALVPGQDRLGEKFDMPQQTAFYQLSSMADAQVLVLTATTSGKLSSAVLCGALADRTGRFSEGQFLYASANQATQTLLGLLPKAGDYYLSLLPANLGGGAGYAFDLKARVAAATTFSTKEAMADSPGSPLADVDLSGPAFFSTDGAFDGPLDVDYVRFKAAKAGRIYVQVSVDGLHLSNPATSIALLQADCVTVVAAAQPVQQEAAVLAGGTVCARISTPPGVTGPYTLIATQGL